MLPDERTNDTKHNTPRVSCPQRGSARRDVCRAPAAGEGRRLTEEMWHEAAPPRPVRGADAASPEPQGGGRRPRRTRWCGVPPRDAGMRRRRASRRWRRRRAGETSRRRADAARLLPRPGQAVPVREPPCERKPSRAASRRCSVALPLVVRMVEPPPRPPAAPPPPSAAFTRRRRRSLRGGKGRSASNVASGVGDATVAAPSAAAR